MITKEVKFVGELHGLKNDRFVLIVLNEILFSKNLKTGNIEFITKRFREKERESIFLQKLKNKGFNIKIRRV